MKSEASAHEHASSQHRPEVEGGGRHHRGLADERRDAFGVVSPGVVVRRDPTDRCR